MDNDKPMARKDWQSLHQAKKLVVLEQGGIGCATPADDQEQNPSQKKTMAQR